MKSTMSAKIQLNNRLVPLTAILLLIIQMTYPHQSWLILLLGLSGLSLVSFFWARTLAQGLHLTRQMRYGWAQVGDRLEESFILTNHGWLAALWVEIADHSTLPDYRVSQVTGVGIRGENKWTTTSVCTRRGIFTLGPTTVHTSDPFNLFSVTLYHPDSATLTVTPPIIPLPTIEVAPGGRAGEGRPHPNALEQTVSAATVRNYLPGDSLRAIHWPTSARRNSLFVHQFENTPAGDWWIILDLDETSQVGQGQDATEEHAIILAASLADRGLRLGREVSLLAYSDDLIWLPPRYGDNQRWQILRALATAMPGPFPLAELLAQPSFGRLTSLIIITPTIDAAWVETLTPLIRHSATATVLLLDPESFGGAGSADSLVALLSDLNVTHHRITPDLLDHLEDRSNRQGQWEWRISPLGRAISRQRPRDMGWRTLG